MAQIKARTGAAYIVNGTIYNPSKFKPFCNFKVNGTIVNGPGYSECGYAWDNGQDIAYTTLPCNKKNYIGCVGMLLNGAIQKMYYNNDMGGKRQRTCIGMRGENFMIYVCNAGHSKTPEALQSYVRGQGWKNALMLDGGGSTQCNLDGKILNSPDNGGKGRIVQNYILVYTKNGFTETPPHTSAKTCPYGEPSSLVKRGASGTNARWVQWHLKELYDNTLSVDGSFGAKTDAALKGFQCKNGLMVDGICGAATRAKLKTCYATK